ncbi:voltage-dependent calcium channel subunit alpha-2/delta-1-like [Amphibalanus amphitrite]|uniref:voltage-dependent calcium channel subunit alpha-2/delta-1-like n=1 Tax=Amphibalanus amphitrite TaxID=1232801 RepID=UPI001C90DC39|nr:voltage-dependent calcium channel subunit alpha-2/delta-1-like [Amphibalanus amphitrite]XP_043211859.1 voltage-dependent calcium channel subunit alpha-2/delta-1-like [Amphibalanus amphitrite]
MHAIRLIQLLMAFSISIGSEIPSSDVVNHWAAQLGIRLKEDFMSASDYETLQDSFGHSMRHSVRFDVVRPEQELALMASQITTIFTRRTQALKDIVNRAESLTLTYRYEKDLQLSDEGVIEDGAGRPVLDAPLFKMADHTADSGQLSPSETLGREVNTSRSGVHTPLEVYEGYVDVLNGLRVTDGVDETFRANAARDPHMSWQYLGTQLGFLRVYPATWWQPPRPALDVDLYDVRRRPWYIEGSVSPKDVVILMDISGSVHGQTFEIMKIAVKTVLNTLGENDYVNIAWSTNQVGWVNPCLNRLVPATMINKRALAAAVDSLQARNTSDWSKGLDFAYRAFIDFYTTEPEHAGAKCHKLIMFFSDGGTEWAGHVIDKYKNETLTENVRLFAYALGPHPVPPNIMRKMACENGGSFSVIVASGAIRTSIQESYLSVLGKPLALSNSHHLAESSPYSDALGLGYVTTLSMPVFNRSAESKSGQSLMGVAGVDISMKELLRHSPWKKLGPFGYTFAINPNGIVVFHPRLRNPLHYMEDPPDLDLVQLEGDSYKVVEMRTQMIRRNSDSAELSQLVPLDDGHQVELRRVRFTWRPVDNTTLSLGLALPVTHKHMVVSGQNVRQGLPDCDACLLAPSWQFCPGLSGNASERWRQLSERLQAGAENCSQDLVQHLLWDVNWTAVAQTLWDNNSRNQSAGVLGRFLVTDGGLTRFHPADSGAGLLRETEPYTSSLYRQASLVDDLVVRPRPGSRRLLAARRIAVTNSTGDIYTLAVAGVQFSSGWLWSLADGVLTEPSAAPACSPESGLLCWLLDTGGHVVYASGELPPLRNDTGDRGGPHLGAGDPELMAALVAAGVYRQTTEYNYQGVCLKPSGEASAGSSLRWLGAQLLFDSAYGLLRWLDYLRYLLVSWLLAAQTAPVSALDEFGFEIQADNHSCTQRQTRTQLVAALRPYQGETSCPEEGDCTRRFRAALVDDTNLLLVVSGLPCGCPPPPGQRPAYEPVEDIGPDRCVESVNQTAPFRKRPDTCFATHENEQPACGGAGTAAGPLSLPLLCLALGLALRPGPGGR